MQMDVGRQIQIEIESKLSVVWWEHLQPIEKQFRALAVSCFIMKKTF